MYRKISTPEDEELLRAGALVIQYPVSGEPEDTIDLSDPGNFVLFELQTLKDGEVHLQLADEKVQQVITKGIAELLKEGTWWIRP